MKNTFKKVFCIAAAAVMTAAAGSLPGGAVPSVSSETGSAADSAAAGVSGVSVGVSSDFEKVLTKGGYSLYYKGENGEIALETPEGRLWYSNPQGENTEELAEEQERSRIKSQIALEYYLEQKPNTMTSYDDSVANQPPEAVTEGDTLSVTYDFGKQEYTNDMLPTVISKERMEKELLPKMSEEDRELVLSRYSLYEKSKMDKGLYDTVVVTFPVLAKHDIYARGSFPDYVGEEIYAAFERIGYTLEDLERDCQENEVENTYTPPVLFSVTVDYTLTDTGFTASIDTDKITYNTVKPTNISLLPFFGCTGRQDTGYMLVPDGSGAVINFNNGKTDASAYSKPIYGEDRTQTVTETGGKEEISALPVFALSAADAGFMGVIASGAECASVNASVSGKNNIFNTVYASFDAAATDLVTVTSSSDGQVLMTSEDFFSEPFSIEYIFCDGYADYSRFAGIYRGYLEENGVLKPVEDNSSVMNIEFTGTAQVKKKLLGFSYNSLAQLTTFEEARAILDQLGADSPQVRFTNAVNGGRNQKYSDRIKFESGLGGEKGYSRLAEASGSLGIGLDVLRVASAKKNSTVKLLNRSIAKQYSFDPISRYVDTGSYSVLLSPSLLPELGEKLVKSAENNGVDTLIIEDIAYEVNSDFDSKHTSDRAQTRSAIEKYMQSVTEAGIKLESDRAGLYSFPYLTRIWDVPTKSSGYFIEDGSVPFYAMVVRGYIPYCVSAINEEPVSRTAFLNAVEIGAGLQFSWIGRTAEDVVSLDEKYYNRLYDRSIEDAKEYYSLYAELYEKLRGAKIISHSVLENGLKATAYDNGITVYVNYTDSELSAGGVSVPAMGFKAAQ